MFLTDFSQVGPGLRWSHQRFGLSVQYRAWYEGDESSLWSNFIWPDGLGFGKQYYTYFNWFRLNTDFWRLACASDDAIMNPGIARGAELLDQLAEFESRDGYLIGRLSGGTVRSVDPVHWAPVYAREDGDVYQGHVLGYPWRQLAAGENPNQQMTPNRIDFHMVAELRQEWRRYEFDGAIVGDLLMTGVSPIERVAVEGDGLGVYRPLAAPSREYAVRMSTAARVLGRHSNPHLQGPASAVIARRDGSLGVDISDGGSYLPKPDADSPDFQYVVWDGQLQAHDKHLQRVVDWIHSFTGIPLAAEGSGSGLVESGKSYERAMFAAVGRVRRTRRRIASLLDQLGFRIEWQLDPFESKGERSASLTGLVGAGILEAQRAKELLGYGTAG